jgi:hypothetical protein
VDGRDGVRGERERGVGVVVLVGRLDALGEVVRSAAVVRVVILGPRPVPEVRIEATPRRQRGENVLPEVPGPVAEGEEGAAMGGGGGGEGRGGAEGSGLEVSTDAPLANHVRRVPQFLQECRQQGVVQPKAQVGALREWHVEAGMDHVPPRQDRGARR